MVNDSFKSMDISAREQKVYKIISDKARDITEEHIRNIMDSIDITKQYTITGTKDITSLLRNAYNEDGGNEFQVEVKPIYGNLTPGKVQKDGTIIKPVADDVPTAFVKFVRIWQDEQEYAQNTVFIYQKRTSRI